MWKTILATAALIAPMVSFAQAPWPNQPVKVIVPQAPGAGTDITARIFTEALARKFGQPFVIDNRPGANGMLGTEAAAKAPKDGYTLLFTYAAAQVVNQSLYAKVNYDGARDFAAVAQVGAGGNVLIVPPSMPVKDLKEFIAYVKSKPADELAYGSWGIGSGGHLSMEALVQQAGLKMRHVPYKGTAPMISDLLGGHLQVAFASTATAIPMMQAGKVKALAYSAPTRSSLLPDVPTMNEQGVKFDLVAWYGLFAPAGTPPAVVNALNQEVNRILQAPDMADKLKAIGLSDWPIKTPEQFGESVRRDIKEWGDLVRKANIKVE
jgi:tripartite-type tricarboxylate transporter receptor subunit TctC